MFREDKVSADAVADGAITDADQLKGMVARNDVYPGEQLTTNQFQRSDTTNVAVKLEPDQRAIAFPVDPASGLIGQLQSGDHVDVVATFDVLPVGKNGVPLTGAQAIPLTRTIVSNALVLTAPEPNGTTSHGDSAHGPSLTLAVDADHVNPILFAQQKGSVWFAVRPPGSHDIGTEVVDVDAVLRGVTEARKPSFASPGRTDDAGDLHPAQHRSAPRLPGRPPRRRDADATWAPGHVRAVGLRGALMAAERDNSEVLLAFTPNVPDVLASWLRAGCAGPTWGSSSRSRAPRSARSARR